MPREQVLGLAEAAVMLKRPYQDAHRLLLIGKLTGSKVGGRWFVTRASVTKLLAEERAAEDELMPA